MHYLVIFSRGLLDPDIEYLLDRLKQSLIGMINITIPLNNTDNPAK